jgi:DNA repair photolyase
MRWDKLRLDDGASAGDRGPQAVPLFGLDALTRTIDTPEFRGITFHEVRAKSIINRVPEASRVPFRWTINPYRGCSHSCVYCMGGETPILMGDGATKALAEVRVGDRVYGTIRAGNYRRSVITDVLAHWSVVKPAYRVTLADGTRLTCSSDHRFLTGRGWKYVTGTEHGRLRRPHITVNSELMGVGAFAEPPKQTGDYRRGYLCGMIRADGHAGVHSYSSRGREEEHCRFRPDLVDSEALDRSRDYLAQLGCGRGEVSTIRWLIRWPSEPTADWRKGFLAGIFDAEGSYSGSLRIASCDPEVLARTQSSLASLGFRAVEDPAPRTNGMAYVRLLGGLREVLRFFHTTDPAITRKRSIAGAALKSDADLRVVSVEPLGLDLPMYDITTGTGDFIADGVVSHNCFARNTHTYLDMDAGHDFNTQIVVKVNAPELARRELAAPRWRGEHVAMGTNVDCYQRAEGRYQLMPGIIGALRAAANPFSILTKGTLILRDLDLLCEAADVTEVGLNVSVGFVDKAISRSVEPGTPAPERRLGVCAAITARGLPCGVLMGPVLPFLTDSPGQLEATVRLAAEAGAAHISPIVLHLRPGAREWFLRWLGETHPDLVEPYRQFYGRGAYAPKPYQQKISDQVAAFAARYGVGRATPYRARRVTAAPPPVLPDTGMQLPLA